MPGPIIKLVLSAILLMGLLTFGMGWVDGYTCVCCMVCGWWEGSGGL